jgi:hypothetical protein
MRGTSRQPQHQASYRACIKDAALGGADLLQATLARARSELAAQAAGHADVVERALLLEAVDVLRDRQQALVDAFPQALLAEFAHAIAGERLSPLSFESLPLLADDQLQDNADMARALRDLEEAVRQPLAQLESVLAALQITPLGAPQRHPLRPEVYVRSVYRLARHSPVAASVRRRWVRLLPPLMADELARTYADIAGKLQPHQPPAAQAASEPLPQEVRDQATQLTIRELRKLLSGEPPDGPGDAVMVFSDTEFSHTVPAALEMAQDLRKVDQLLQQLRQRQAAMPSQDRDSLVAFREALRAEARQPAQALGLEVVHLMLEQLAADPRLLPAVREVVSELEPPLLRLALSDPRFFSDRAHPARQLLEQVTQRSLAWTSPDQPGFTEFMDGLQQATEALLDSRVNGPEAFEVALHALQEAWEEAQPRSRRNRERAVRALMRAEQRNLLAERIGRQVLERPDAAAAPPEALAFLTGPWAQVMAQARLMDTGGDEDPGGFGWVIPTVLWGVQPALAGRVANQQALLAERIRGGLAGIDHLPADTQRWLNLLAALHELALSATGARARPAEPMPEKVTTWLAPLEIHESGYLPEQAIPIGSSPWEPDTLPSQDMAIGAFVDLHGQSWERWQLTWASPHGLLFMFTHANGSTRSMTRRKLQQMLAQGSLRLVSAHPVVDGALDAIAQAAWRNSL